MTCPAKICAARCDKRSCSCPPCTCADCRMRAADGARRTARLAEHRAQAASRAWLYPTPWRAGAVPEMSAGPADAELALRRPPVVEQVPLFDVEREGTRCLS